MGDYNVEHGDWRPPGGTNSGGNRLMQWGLGQAATERSIKEPMRLGQDGSANKIDLVFAKDVSARE